MSNRRDIALCSGGTDSVAATHWAMTHGKTDEVVFLHTRTDPADAYSAIDATVDWIEAWCENNGWPFRVEEAPQQFTEITAEEGTPSPRTHFIMWRRLKDRPIDELRKRTEGDLHCWTGIRRWESERRAEVAEPEGERGDGRWVWHAPLVEWTDADVEEYLDKHGIEPADVVQEIGRSCDCWCGCFGDRNELLDLEAAGFKEHADYLRNLPTPDDAPKAQQQWAGFNWDKADWAEQDDLQTTLCSSCARADGGRVVQEADDDA